MNKAQKQVQQAQLSDEQKTIKQLQGVYAQARKDCEQKIRELSSRTDLENLQSIIYQKQYQKALKKQLDGILDALQSREFSSVADYLTKSYENGYVGVMYDLHKQGIPVIMPINQEQVVKALQTDSKLSQGLYSRLGEDVSQLKSSIRAELSRGIANGSTWNQIAGYIADGMNSPFNKAYNNAIRIARTEGHRIQQRSALDSQKAAKDKGADVVKQWCSTLDGATRETHQKLDGQIRAIDEDFEVDGMRAPYPGGFGDPAEDCNCRCCLLQRARWALDQDELDELKERAEYFGLDKSADFEEFKGKYLENFVVKDSDSGIIKSGAVSGALTDRNDPLYVKRDRHAESYYRSMKNSKKDGIVKTISKNTGLSEKAVSKVYDHLFVNRYDLYGGTKSFDPDYDMAESFRRLREGKNIQEHDIIMLKHERLEHGLMNKLGMPYDDAHELAQSKYNYQQSLNEFKKKNGL